MSTHSSRSAKGAQSLGNRPQFNLAQYTIGESARKWPDKCALEIWDSSEKITQQNRLTYRELETAICNTALGLTQSGVTKGDRILLRLENNINFVFAFFGAIAAGTIPVPMSAKLTTEEIDFFAADTKTKWLIKSPALPTADYETITTISEAEINRFATSKPGLETTPAYAATSEEDPAFLIYTSGTTSRPKGVLHAQRVVLGRAPMRGGWHDIGPDDRVMHAGDFNWTYTIGIGLIDPWTYGATACLYQGEKQPRRWPQIIETIKPSIFAAVPGLYRQILKYGEVDKHQLSSLRHGLCAGEVLPIPLQQAWEEATGIPLYKALGQSEISTYASTSPNFKTPMGRKGRIQEGRRVAILSLEQVTGRESETPLPAGDIGLIAIHEDDPGLMLGYWRNGAPSKESFRGPWFLTGDLGSLDEAGFLTHHGRHDEVMNPSGYRVSPHEVEAAIAKSPHIEEVAVYEKQVREDLTIIEALVVTGKTIADEQQLIEALQSLLQQRLAAYKHPKSYRIVTALPRNKSGKVTRSALPDWQK